MVRAVGGVLRVGAVPRHLALIMDGNRRHGVKTYNHHHRREGEGQTDAFRIGHEAGFTALMRAMKWSFQLGVERLTVFAFSQENWKRDAREVEQLVAMLADKLKQMEDEEGIAGTYRLLISELDKIGVT